MALTPPLLKWTYDNSQGPCAQGEPATSTSSRGASALGMQQHEQQGLVNLREACLQSHGQALLGAGSQALPLSGTGPWAHRCLALENIPFKGMRWLMQAGVGLAKAFSKGIDLHFNQRKSFPNQMTFVVFLNHFNRVCLSRESDTLGFALKDMILCDHW